MANRTDDPSWAKLLEIEASDELADVKFRKGIQVLFSIYERERAIEAREDSKLPPFVIVDTFKLLFRNDKRVSRYALGNGHTAIRCYFCKESHKESGPMLLNHNSHTFYCSACEIHGDAYTAVMRKKNKSLKEAGEWLSKNVPLVGSGTTIYELRGKRMKELNIKKRIRRVSYE